MARRVITDQIVAPAAGVDFSFIPSSTDRVLLLAITAKLTASAAVANRRPAIAFKDQSAGVFWSADTVYPQTAGLAVTYSWARSGGNGTDPTVVASERVSQVIPHMWLQPNDTIQAITALLDVGDVWSAITYRALIGDMWEDEQELARLAEAFTAAIAS